MRKIKKLAPFLYLFVGLSLLSSCNKDDDSSETAELIGTWTWIESRGGIDGRIETPESTGRTARLEINETTLKSYVNNVLNFEREFVIETRESTIISGIYEMMIYDNGNIDAIYLLTSNELTLGQECNDCFISDWTRN